VGKKVHSYRVIRIDPNFAKVNFHTAAYRTHTYKLNRDRGRLFRRDSFQNILAGVGVVIGARRRRR
jgi:hypothetical protein